VKQANKQKLVDHVRDTLWLNLDPSAIFDVQVKRLHEYKRQLLNALHIVALWIRARENPARWSTPGCSSSGPRPPRATCWPSSSSG
jgi:starch phosphorylase